MEELYKCSKCKKELPINNKILHDFKCKSAPLFLVVHDDDIKNKKKTKDRKNKNSNNRKTQPEKRKYRHKSNKYQFSTNDSLTTKESKDSKKHRNKTKKIDKNENKKAIEDINHQQDFNIIDNKNNSNFNNTNQPLSGNNGDNNFNNRFNMGANNYFRMNQVPMNMDYRSNINQIPMNMNPYFPIISINGININSMTNPFNYVQFNNVNYIPPIPNSSFNSFQSMISPNELKFNEGLEQGIINNLPETQIRDASKLTPDKKECSICLEEFMENDYITYLPCIHAFHGKCIKDWLKRSNECPICKFKITKETLNYQ
jgi:hypothetical protein